MPSLPVLPEAKARHTLLFEAAQTFGVYPLARYVLDDARFDCWSGSSAPHVHHYGNGGLIQHTWEVWWLAKGLNESVAAFHAQKSVDPEALFLACLFHDAGKMWDYDYTVDHNGGVAWHSTEHKHRIHHVTRSAMLWQGACMLVDKYESALCQAVTHAILAHHGQPDWGSPVRPQTRLAWLLHLADMTSARLDDCERRDPAKKPHA